jgi:hypothetical protein
VEGSLTTPADPLAFDFGISFKPSSERVMGERKRRSEMTSHRLEFGLPFLDDCLRSILPNDLVLIGSASGVGKTELAKGIAVQNAFRGKTVHYLALEAEEDEIERRAKYAVLVKIAKKSGADIRGVNYTDWYLGNLDGMLGKYEDDAEAEMGGVYRNLRTYYKGRSFSHADISRLFLAVQSETDLLVLDHLHYVDIDDENENRGLKQLTKTIRDVNLSMGKPIVMVVHLRKRDQRARTIVPDLDSIHGSSDVPKIATRVIMMAPARCLPSKHPQLSHTFIHVPKDRMSGTTGHVALCIYDRGIRRYSDVYTLGYETDGGEFEAIDTDQRPTWAKRHVPLSQNIGGSL